MTAKKFTLSTLMSLLAAAGVSVLVATTSNATEYEIPVLKEQCKDDGWVSYVDDLGDFFNNQGDCVSFVVPVRESGPAPD